MLQDVRFALRLLNRQRGYAAMAILTFALGVGANAAVFSVADSVLFRPLPFADAARLFALRLADPKTGAVYGTLPASTVEAARATGVVDAVATVSSRTWRAYIRTAHGLDALSLAPASRQYLDLLGVRPIAGRSFDVSDEGTRAVLLAHAAWLKHYGGDAGVVGSTIQAILRPTERSPATQPPVRIVGVLPPRVRLPLIATSDGIVLEEETASGAEAMFAPLVRLAPGFTEASARARLQTVSEAGQTLRVRLVPLREDLAARQDPVLWLLLGAAAIVLLTGCVNLANLTMARGAGRMRELAIRASLGSPRARLVRLLLAEAICVAAVGTIVGLAVGAWSVRSLAAVLPAALAGVSDPRFDVRAFVFTLAVAASAALLFSVFPALRLTRRNADAGLRQSMQMTAPSRRGPQVLVCGEVAICVALVAGAVLVGRTLLALTSQDLGFTPHRFIVNFDLPTMVIEQGGMLRTDTAARSAFYLARLRDVRAIAGVRAAALASAVPFSGIRPDAALLAGRGDQAGGVYSISSGYFQAMGIPFLAGRDLTDEESFGAAAVGILNLTGARALCGAPASCIGRVIASPGQSARTVVGVVADARPSLVRAQMATMYVPFQSRFALKTLVISADDDRATVGRITRALSTSGDARVDMQVLEEAVDRELAPYRFNAIAIGGFALLTLLLAVIGVYGVMSAIVGQRTREYGVRIALGATPARINGHVLAMAAVPLGAGVGAGLVVAAWASRFFDSLLFGVVPIDPVSFVGAAVVLVASGIGAAVVPARRAASVDPVVSLRAE